MTQFKLKANIPKQRGIKNLFAASLLFLISFGTVANTAVDSLLSLGTKIKESERADLYLSLSSESMNDSAKSIYYAKLALESAQKTRQSSKEAKALCQMGETLLQFNENHSAITYVERAIEIYAQLKDSLSLANCYRVIGNCYQNMDHGDQAIANYIEGLKLCEKDTAITNRILNNIGSTHARLKNYSQALDYFKKALRLNTLTKSQAGMAVCYNNMGEVYLAIGKPDSALYSYKMANHIDKKPEFQAKTLNNLGGIYLNYRDSIGKALECYRQSWNIFRHLGMYQYEAEFKQGLGVIYFRTGKFGQAIDAFNSSNELIDKFNRGYKLKANNMRLLSTVYEKNGDYLSALKYMKLFNQYSDSIAQKEKTEKLAMLEKQYETEKKEAQIAKLQARQELTLIQLRKNKQLKQLGLATAFLLSLLVLFIVMKYRDKIKSNKILEEKNRVIEKSEQELRILNASKNKFFSIIAHDLKNPLHNVLGYSHLLSQDYNLFTDEERRKFATDINRSTNNIFRLLQNLLEWSKSQTGRLNFSPAVVDYQRLLDNSLGVLKSLADQKKIRITIENDPELKIYADPLMMETVLRNLINNAIKFTPEGGQIDVSAKVNDGEVLVSVKDTGVGISEEESKNLFRIDSKVKRKGTNNEDGSGLGLILCQEFVTKHNGKIWVESTPGRGSEFYISIPAKAIA